MSTIPLENQEQKLGLNGITPVGLKQSNSEVDSSVERPHLMVRGLVGGILAQTSLSLALSRASGSSQGAFQCTNKQLFDQQVP